MKGTQLNSHRIFLLLLVIALGSSFVFSQDKPSPQQDPPPEQPPTQRRDVSPVPTGAYGLEYFGYEVFKDIPEAFEPTAVGPVDPGYLLGPGDVLRLTVWGQAEFQYELQVDREGRIFIPNVGQVFVMGTPLEKLEQKLKKQMSKYYSGLAADPPTVFMDVTIAKLKPLRIFVMGEVKRPGGYTISSYATVFNALYAVGGPLVRGSLRSVKVLRENKLVAVVDLYDYLLKGDQTSDVRLQNNDVVFIPPRGKTVSIRGEIRRPAIYELKENEHITKLLEFSGGLLSSAYIGRAQIDRIKPFENRDHEIEDRIVVDFSLDEVIRGNAVDVKLFDLDDVQIFSILDEKRNYVDIKGAVWRPGRYELGKIKTITDLITAAKGLKPETYLGKADIQRLRLDLTREFISVNLEKALAHLENQNIELQGKDVVRIYSIHEIEFEKTITISGHVKNPQEIPFHDSLTLYDLVFRAGGLLDSEFRKKAFLPRADIFRLNEDKISRRIIPFSLEKLLADSTYTIPLEPSDVIVIYNIGVVEILDKFVVISGEVKKPGRYPWRSNLDLQSLILDAGGFTEEAEITEAEVTRIVPGGLGNDSLVLRFCPKLSSDLTSIEAGSGFLLQHRDHVLIHRNPNFNFHQNVDITGDITHPGTYSLMRRGERLSELLTRAGGPTTTSYLGGAEFWRGDKRLIVNFEKAYLEKDEEQDVPLIKGDSIYIPSRPFSVAVFGEVNNEGLLSFIEGDDVSDYIDRAGGLTDSAYYAILIMPTGESRRVNFGLFRADPEVPEGSIIRVLKIPPPSPEEKIDVTELVKETFAILTSAATLAFIVWQVTK